VALRLEGQGLVEIAQRPLRPVRALAQREDEVLMLDDRGVLLRLVAGRWRRGFAGLAARGWGSMTPTRGAFWLASETGEVVRVAASEVTRLPVLPTAARIVELVAAEHALLLRTVDRLWLWDGQRWRDRGATPDDCSAVDYCVGHVTQLATSGDELWALRDGVPERHFPRAGALPFFEGRVIDEMAVGTRGELFWTRHDAGRSELLRLDEARVEVVGEFDPVRLWPGADGSPRFVDAAGDLFRYDASTGDFERRATAPCRHSRVLLGHGNHAYVTCPGEPGVVRRWTGERYARLVCPERVCGAPVRSARIVGSGFPLSMSAPGRGELLVTLQDGNHALRHQGEWRRIDDVHTSVANLQADATAASLRQVDDAGRVWSLMQGRLVFDGPDDYSGGHGIVTEEALPTLARFAMTPDARVIWAADPAGRLFRLSARPASDRTRP
jgi:hypothetical protein